MNADLKKLLRGKKGCAPASHLWKKRDDGTAMKGSKLIGQGEYGKVFRGCITRGCKKYVVYKETSDPSARMEFTIAKKLEGMGVPDMYLYKSCDGKDILYSEYIDGKELGDWWKTIPSFDKVKSVMVQVIYNLYQIQQRYPKFRHHDLHIGNILVRPTRKKNIHVKMDGAKNYKISNAGVEAVIIDFGFSVFPRIKNPKVNAANYKNIGIFRDSNPLYDLHYFLNNMFYLTRQPMSSVRGDGKIKKFLTTLLPKEYLQRSSKFLKNMRLRGTDQNVTNVHIMVLPGFETVLSHKFFTGVEKKFEIPEARKIQPKIMKKQDVPKTPRNAQNAVARAAAILAATREKPKITATLRRPGVRTIRPIQVTPSPKLPPQNENVMNYVPIAQLKKFRRGRNWNEMRAAKELEKLMKKKK